LPKVVKGAEFRDGIEVAPLASLRRPPSGNSPKTDPDPATNQM
jgi:hypothetical protein